MVIFAVALACAVAYEPRAGASVNVPSDAIIIGRELYFTVFVFDEGLELLLSCCDDSWTLLLFTAGVD